MLELVTAWSTLILAVVSSVALVIAAVQIAENRRGSRLNATLEMLSEAAAAEESFRYFDQNSDQRINRDQCLGFFLQNVERRDDSVSRYFLGNLYALVNLTEHVGTLAKARIIDLPLFLRSQSYNVLSSYFVLEPVLMQLAKDELLMFEEYRHLSDPSSHLL